MNFKNTALHPRGITPYTGLYGQPLPKSQVFFFRLQVYKRTGIALVEVNETDERASVNSVVKGLKELTDAFNGHKKVQKRFWFSELQFIFSY